MENYLIYLGLAVATVLLPGPAVFLTINNVVQAGFSKAFAGIVGIALAILIVAGLSATSLGVVLANSVMAFTIIKYLGAAYLIFLGLKIYLSKQEAASGSSLKKTSFIAFFVEGFFVSISNPKAVIFFMSIFPQFINPNGDYVSQVSLLAITFSVLVVVIHTLYAILVSCVKGRGRSLRSRILTRITGGIFVIFGVGLAASNK